MSQLSWFELGSFPFEFHPAPCTVAAETACEIVDVGTVEELMGEEEGKEAEIALEGGADEEVMGFAGCVSILLPSTSSGSTS